MPFEWMPIALVTFGAVAAGVLVSYAFAIQRPGASQVALFVPMFLVLVFPPILTQSPIWQLRVGLGATAFVVLATHHRFCAVDERYGNAVRSLGASEWRIFWRVMLPMAWGPILAGAAFALLRTLMGPLGV